MIFVDRLGALIPDLFESDLVTKERQRAEEFFLKREKAERLQERFDFSTRIAQEARGPLAELFKKKCAYCESPFSASAPADVDCFRPRTEATGLITRSKVGSSFYQSDPDGYWWLAYEWSNLYFSCAVCARNKHNQFPVVERRATFPAKGDALRAEAAVLIDPCFDLPEDHLVFNEDGSVSGVPPKREQPIFQGVNRGAVTIDVFGLNRTDLVEARKLEASLAKAELEHVAITEKQAKAKFSAETRHDQLRKIMDPARPYAQLRQQFTFSLAPRLMPDLTVTDLRKLIETPPEQPPSEAAKPITLMKPIRFKHAAPPIAKSAGHIESISIRNFRAIRQFDTRLATPSDGDSDSKGKMGWKVLLGENGAGKSTILQAVSLALMGPKYVEQYWKRFRLKPADLLRKVRGEQRARQASIQVQFSNGHKVVLKITPRKAFFESQPESEMYLRAYGATRLLPRRNETPPPVVEGAKCRVDNLFDPGRPVLDANGWLARHSRQQKSFGSIALALKDLLGLPKQARLSVKSRQVMVPMNGLQHPLDELSAGFESVLVMAADILAGIKGTVHDPRLATGIVLLDEIDAHLHPRWKMRIVDSLRNTFSSMQFIVTTHEPLCLRGLLENEVMVLKREGNDIRYIDNLPSPGTLRVEQLLTSDLFGLNTTIDPVLDQKFTAYYSLLARPQEELNERQRALLERLRTELPPVRAVQLLGDTRRERMIYEVVDQYLAKEVVHRNEAVRNQMNQTVREDVKRQVAELWTQISPPPNPEQQ